MFAMNGDTARVDLHPSTAPQWAASHMSSFALSRPVRTVLTLTSIELIALDETISGL